jgi:hypothetical protein
MGSRAQDDARWSAVGFVVGDPDGADIARQAEGLIGSIISLLGLTLRVPDHTTLSRRSATLAVPRLPPTTAANGDARRIHLLVDSTGLKLCGASVGAFRKWDTKRDRSDTCDFRLTTSAASFSFAARSACSIADPSRSSLRVSSKSFLRNRRSSATSR